MNRKQPESPEDARREQAVARRLGETLARLAPAGAHNCLDAEQIAAYRQRSLAPDEIVQFESHLAACARCRDVLAVLGAAGEEPLAADRAAAAASAAEAARPAAARPPRARLWRSLWLVPALAATAAMAVWLMLRLPEHALTPGSSQPLSAEVSRTTQLPREENPSAPAPSEAPAEAPSAGQLPPTPPIEPKQPAPNAPSEAAAAQQPESAESSAESGAGAAANAAALGAAIASAQPALPSPPPAAAAAAPPAAAEPPRPEFRAAVRAPANPNLLASARVPMIIVQAPRPQSFGSLANSPASPISWRAGAAGLIERSVDGGLTWQPQQSPLHEDWLVGSAVSGTVCWLAGRNGAIARTEDGEHWQQVPAPSAAAGGKLPDWISITATGPQAATIASANQRYVTRDAGTIWLPLPADARPSR